MKTILVRFKRKFKNRRKKWMRRLHRRLDLWQKLQEKDL